MRVLLVNTYARSGGASVAAQRLCAALNGAGVEARLLVQNPEGSAAPDLLTTADRWAVRRPWLDALPTFFYRNRRTPHWGNAWLNNRATRQVISHFAPEVIHLHWVNHGMLSVHDIARLRGPLVWTLHDSWVFTGGCHSPQDCLRYQQQCGYCPELRSQREQDLSWRGWQRKQTAWRGVSFTVITPSRWLAAAAASSSLMAGRRIVVIPNAVDTATFKPSDRAAARHALGLPANAPVFLFGAHGAASDWNKGLDLWQAALPFVARQHPEAIALVAGLSGGTLSGLPLPVRELGMLNPTQLAQAMLAADATVIPSRMENLPNIAAESLACGTPVAAFAVGGIPEMIENGSTGFLARPHEPESLAQALGRLLAQGAGMRAACITAAQGRYAPDLVARQHIELYQSLLEPE